MGLCVAGYALNLGVFTAAHVLIGIGAGTWFGPMMADISQWLDKRRGLAVVIVASGNYFTSPGTIWPLLRSLTIPQDHADFNYSEDLPTLRGGSSRPSRTGARIIESNGRASASATAPMSRKKPTPSQT